MQVIEKHIQVNDYLTKSNLPASDYVINLMLVALMDANIVMQVL